MYLQCFWKASYRNVAHVAHSYRFGPVFFPGDLYREFLDYVHGILYQDLHTWNLQDLPWDLVIIFVSTHCLGSPAGMFLTVEYNDQPCVLAVKVFHVGYSWSGNKHHEQPGYVNVGD